MSHQTLDSGESVPVGRFLSSDPIRYRAGDINLYRFVGNNPYGSLDPMGLLWSPNEEKFKELGSEMTKESWYTLLNSIGVLPSSFSKRLYRNYLFGEGKDIVMTSSEISFMNPLASLRRQKGFVQILRDACESGTKNINEIKFAGTGVYLWHLI
jgi:uncharacterized protein RhaS with RHS repeats